MMLTWIMFINNFNSEFLRRHAISHISTVTHTRVRGRLDAEWVQVGRLISLTLRPLYTPPSLAPITNRERKERGGAVVRMQLTTGEPGEGTIMQVAVSETGGWECVHSFLDSTLVALFSTAKRLASDVLSDRQQVEHSHSRRQVFLNKILCL